jgi:hypothetical protein
VIYCQEMSTAWHLPLQSRSRPGLLVAVAAELCGPRCCFSLPRPDSCIICRSPPSLSSASVCFSFFAQLQLCHDLSNQCLLLKQPRNPATLQLSEVDSVAGAPVRLSGSRLLGPEVCTATAAESTISSSSKAERGSQQL